jgi:hypothetical protein
MTRVPIGRGAQRREGRLEECMIESFYDFNLMPSNSANVYGVRKWDNQVVSKSRKGARYKLVGREAATSDL